MSDKTQLFRTQVKRFASCRWGAEPVKGTVVRALARVQSFDAGDAHERKPRCWGEDSGLGQYPKLTGTWQDSSTEGFRGFYDASAECPEYGHDFDCRRPYKGMAI